MSAQVHRNGPPVHQLVIKETFDRLSPRERLCAHHLARAAWHGARVIMRQVSPESTAIFDFVIELYRSCDGDWPALAKEAGLSQDELASFLEYAALFLCNLGNYFGEGDQKSVLDLSADALRRLAVGCPKAIVLLATIEGSLLMTPPWTLGWPSENSQSNYYSGSERITSNETKLVSAALNSRGVELENTRVKKVTQLNGDHVFEVQQASSSSGIVSEFRTEAQGDVVNRLTRCDHASEMSRVRVLDSYIESFQTGRLDAFRKSQQKWVTDISPRVENIIGFVEPYRDPQGVRAEWEAVVGISDPVENARMRKVVSLSRSLINSLPWAVPGVNEGNGPFEKELFEAPDFISLHALALCSSVTWEAANLPNYNDIRETCGFKNIVIANRLSANDNPASVCHYVDAAEAPAYKKSASVVRFITTVVHEVVGHGSGKLLSETSPGKYNFDAAHPPVNPLTGSAVDSWYLPGQTWTSVFGKIAASAEECRAMLVGNVLMDNKDLLSVFGHDANSEITADDLVYHSYISIGVEGLEALEAYDIRAGEWGQPHLRAHWAILKHLLSDGRGTISITHDPGANRLTVSVDRSKVLSHGKPALADFLCRLHIWRCTADAESCAEYYNRASAVEEEAHLQWRDVVLSHTKPRWKFAQANTFLVGDGPDAHIQLKVYPETNEGIIQSWVERDV